jgi:DNA-binding response OmpR family regulator
MARVLVVEDDAAIAQPLVRALEREGYDVTPVTSGATAVDVAAGLPVDLVVLDLGLPDLDGIEVCRRIRATHADLPILILTARREELDAVVGLDAGADDYVTKPFRLAELMARLRALQRRARPQAEQVAAQDVRVDVSARRAWHGAEELDLTAKEFDLLALLVREAGNVVTRERIMDEVWDEHWYGPTKTLDTHLSWLRRKLDDDAVHPRYITTLRGVGFRFERD